MSAVLSASHVSKSFGAVRALRDVSLELRPNEILGLIGQNGSGKSTMLRILTGAMQPSEGTLTLRGKPVVLGSPVMAARLGIGMVHQEQSLIPNLTVAENIFFDKATPGRRLGFYYWARLYREAKRQLGKLESAIGPDTLVENLSFSERQMVEFAKVLAVEDLIDEPLVILFDEPTSLLAKGEVDDLFRQIRRLRERASVVFVSHRMDEVLEISDRVHVMSDGQNVAERTRQSTTHEELYHLMVGSKRSEDYYFENRRRPLSKEAPRLVVQGLSAPERFKNVSLSVRPGEIVGMTGVAGSGAENVCRAIFGAEDGVTGSIAVNGAPVPVGGMPDASIARGIGYVPAERKAEGVLLGRTILENVILTFGPSMGWHGIVDRRRETEGALRWINTLKVKASSPADLIERLSGGNQQKVAVAKWLMADKLDLLILDHPTRGLDPGAKADLFETMRDLAAHGMSIIFVADTLEETLGMADTIIVMRDGEVSARFNDLCRAKPAPEVIVAAMV